MARNIRVRGSPEIPEINRNRPERAFYAGSSAFYLMDTLKPGEKRILDSGLMVFKKQYRFEKVGEKEVRFPVR